MVHAERSRPNLKRAVDARRKVKEEAPTMPATNPELFPRSSRYNPEWLIAGLSGAANPLWMAEWLTAAIDLQPGMRVLDLGCGRATSSIFLAREFKVQVWATDLWFNPAENAQRIRDAGAKNSVFAIHAEARSLPFSDEFFDVIVSLDSFPYYGTDDLYLNYLARFVKPGGVIGIAGAGLMQEIDCIPEHLCNWWTNDLWCLHSAPWWRRLIAPDNQAEICALEADRGEYLGYVRVVGRRTTARLLDPIRSISTHYTSKPMIVAD